MSSTSATSGLIGDSNLSASSVKIRADLSTSSASSKNESSTNNSSVNFKSVIEQADAQSHIQDKSRAAASEKESTPKDGVDTQSGNKQPKSEPNSGNSPPDSNVEQNESQEKPVNGEHPDSNLRDNIKQYSNSGENRNMGVISNEGDFDASLILPGALVSGTVPASASASGEPFGSGEALASEEGFLPGNSPASAELLKADSEAPEQESVQLHSGLLMNENDLPAGQSNLNTQSMLPAEAARVQMQAIERSVLHNSGVSSTSDPVKSADGSNSVAALEMSMSRVSVASGEINNSVLQHSMDKNAMQSQLIEPVAGSRRYQMELAAKGVAEKFSSMDSLRQMDSMVSNASQIAEVRGSHTLNAQTLQQTALSALLSQQPSSTGAQSALTSTGTEALQSLVAATVARGEVSDLNGNLRSDTASGLMGRPLNALESGFASQLAQKILIMQGGKLSAARLQLEPQELGRIDVQIRVQSETLDISFQVQQLQAKEIIEQHLSRLRAFTEESGLMLGNVDVNHSEHDNTEGEEEGRGSFHDKDSAEEQFTDFTSIQNVPQGLIDAYI